MQMLVGWLRPQAPECQRKALWLCRFPAFWPSVFSVKRRKLNQEHRIEKRFSGFLLAGTTSLILHSRILDRSAKRSSEAVVQLMQLLVHLPDCLHKLFLPLHDLIHFRVVDSAVLIHSSGDLIDIV